MESSGSEEELSDMKRPPLVRDLRAILEEYPDNGQIFKELIQNAEDAGASEVRIIYDSFGAGLPTGSCPHFEGPAIYVCNNARFTEEDWDGIKMLRKSVKEVDPLKVGRYGLGFKSVFHITDFPSITSGNTLLLLDPSKPEHKVCATYRLSNQRSKTVQRMRQVFGKVLDMSSLDSATRDGIDGTIFRFPLRRSGSELSSVVYDDERVSGLLKCFKTEMMLVLVFLKSLECVEIWSLRPNQKSPDLSFSVRLTDESAKQRRYQKHIFIKALDEKTTSTWTSSVNCEVVDHSSGQRFSLNWTVVSLSLGKGEMSSSLRALSDDPTLSYPPLVGVSVVDVPSMTRRAIVGMGLLESALQGHIYCFLPLPLQHNSLTGLPVQVNGYFALSSNRHHLKWPTADEEHSSRGSLRDKSCQWNHGLLTEVVPSVYLLLIQGLIETSKRNGNQERFVQAVYRAFPSVRSVSSMWVSVVEGFYKHILTCPCFFSEQGGGKWVTFREAVFCGEKPNIPEEVIEILMSLGITVTSVPERVFDQVRHFVGNQIWQVTPRFVRNVLKKTKAYEQGSHFKRLQLLNFIMEDLVENKDFGDLFGIRLLPLSDGTFTTFKDQREETKFQSTKTFDRCLFPGLEQQFLTEPSIHQFPDGLNKKLKIMIQSGKTQLRPVMEDDIPKLIGQVTEIVSKADTMAWITKVWETLCSLFPSNLHKFQGLDLLPISTEFEVILEKLQTPSLKVLKRHDRTVLSEEVESVVKKMGVHVLAEVAPEVLKHPSVLGVFILEPTASSVLQALTTARGNSDNTEDLSLTKQQRSAFVSFIASCDRAFTAQEHKLLVSLRLFEAIAPRENISHVSVQELKVAAPEEIIPITFPCSLIVFGSLEEKRLGTKLGIRQLNHGDLVVLVIKKMLQEPKVYNRSQVLHFMEHVLGNHSGLNEEVWDLVRNISFVPCTDEDRTLQRPSELFDPTIPKLKDLLVGEDVFPDKEWESYTPILRRLGLKTVPTEQDLLSCAVKLENMQTGKEQYRKCRAVISAIANWTNLSQTIVDALKTVAILPIKREKPSHFPKKMPWFSSTRFLATPSEAMDKRYQNLIGAVMPITVLPDDLTETQRLNLVQMLQLRRPPSVPKLLEQMKLTVRNFDLINVDFFATVVKEIYRELQKFSYQAVWSEINNQNIDPEWIWDGKEFRSSRKIYVEQANEDLDLAPYMVCLPKDVCDLKDFFLAFGCRRNQDQEMLFEVLHMIKREYSKPKAREKGKTQRDIQIVLSILYHLSSYIEEGNLLDAAKILIPVEVAGIVESFEMMPVNQCAYYDSSEWVSVEDISADDRDIHIVHRNVPRELAYSLGVSPLMDKLIDAQELDMNYGQSEPLTRRLRNLIQHYTDGVAVIKEIVQNADDAGATHVCFLYDERQNTNCRSRLIYKNMAECQGPALWTYNNAVFSDEDFQNITKISGATKLYNAAKIGKFGLGFNAVYNLTDVPSFVSRDLFVIFDPHETFLGKPGLKMNVRKNRRMVSRLREQFQPYKGVFGCDFQAEGGLNFQGTLFRFPLRTSEQADRSQISNVHYSHREMVRLLQMSLECAGNLLMFTRNVRDIKFFHLSSVEADASKQTLLFEVSKSKTDHMIMVQMNNNNEECKKLNLTPFCERKTEVRWLVTSSRGGEKVSHFLSANPEMEALQPEASVAIPVKSKGDQACQAMQLEKCPTGFLKHGLMYCYLPLPIPTKLPCMLNGSFSVTSDRRRLSEKSVDEKNNRGSEWNEILLEDSMAKSYINALQLLATKGHRHMFELWPTEANCDTYLEPLLRGFYGSVLCDDQEILPGIDRFTRIENAVFLENKLRFDTGKTGQVAFAVFHELLKKTEKVAVDLPQDIRECFSKFGERDCLANNTFSIHEFYTKLFLPRIEEIEPEQRDLLVLHALKSGDPVLLVALKGTRCIPVDNTGSLCMPSDLVHPTGEIACLYDDWEKRFPVGNTNTFCNPLILDVLINLGMMKDILSPMEILGRACTIERQSQCEPDKALIRFKALCGVLVKMNRNNSLDLTADVKDKLNTKRFLPVLQRPPLWPQSLQWKADGGPRFECPRNLYHDREKNLVGSQRLILNCDGLKYDSEAVLKKLGLLTEVSTADLVLHMRALSKITSELSSDELTSLQHIYDKVYSSLEKRCNESEEIPDCLRRVTELNCIFHEKQHVSPQSIAFEFNYNCSPFLFRLSERYSRLYPNTMYILGVRKTFNRLDLMASLQKFYKKYNDTSLDSDCIRLLNRIMTALVETVHSEHDTQLKEELNEIMLPDEKGKLCLPEMLCFNDCSWISESSGVMRYVHKSVSRETAELLGVKTKQHWCSSENALGIQISFGQKEDLTNRLKRILQGYPCDSTILKELLQNADDAGATEIQFIKDWRSHKKEKIFSEEWKELQGPALCVYNDAAFSDEDLEGIQSLGKGSKRDDPLKTGKYGIGFNVVYHLTDVPSFLIKSRTEEILCAFDPNRKYIPNMSPMLSGMKWQNLRLVRQRFPDMFSCYPDSILEQHTVGTLFRFPLRSESMAEKSEIKNEPISVDELDNLLEKFKNEGKDALLFTKNVQSVKIIEVTQDGTLKTVWEIRANLDEDSLAQKKHLQLQRRNIITELHSGLPFENMKTTEVKYFVEIQEQQTTERWFVKQRIGFEKPEDVSEKVKEAISKNSLKQLPIGGVAFPLLLTRQRPCKAFCGLPLPVPTGLPVQIDGDFALDYEQRRHLSYSPHGDVETKWNKALAEQLLAPLYASGIVDLTQVLFEATDSVQGSLEQYYRFFPLNEKAKDHYWKNLCLTVYRYLDSTSSRVLSVTHKTQSGRETVKRWLPPTGEHTLQAFFNTLNEQCDKTVAKLYGYSIVERREEYKPVAKLYGYGIVERREEATLPSARMASLLLTLNFNLVSTPLKIYENFLHAKIDVKGVLPDSVVTFLRTYADENSLCNIGNLPCLLGETSFRTKDRFIDLLSYCKDSDKLNESLEGLPLLLTCDKTLRVFRESEKVFVSRHSLVVPHSTDKFLDQWTSTTLRLSGEKLSKTPQVKPFGVVDFSTLLQEELDQSVFGRNQPVYWSGRVPEKSWLMSVWHFLTEEVIASNQTATRESLLDSMEEILSWSLLPVTRTEKREKQHYLVPVRFADQVFMDSYWPITDHLRKAGFYMYYSLEEKVELAMKDTLPEKLVIHCCSAGEILAGVTRTLSSSLRESVIDLLKPELCEGILRSFSDRLEHVKETPNHKLLLRQLPLFVTVYNEGVKINDVKAIVLPETVPPDGMDEWSQSESLVLLKENSVLTSLYDYLELASCSEIDFYCQFLFKSFQLLDEKTREIHLKFVRDGLIPQALLAGNDTLSGLQDALQKLPFIPYNQKLERASCFYDHKHYLFKAMLKKHKFVPAPFCEEQWYQMITMAGLNSKVSVDLFVELAKQLEEGACNKQEEKTILEKSQRLIKNLFKEQKENTFLLERVKNIKFLISESATDELQAIAPWYRPSPSMTCFEGSALPKHKELVWSSSDVLREYCVPNSKKNREQILKTLGVRKEPTPEVVVQNLQNIIHRMNNGKQLQKHRDKNLSTGVKICFSIYTFLQGKELTEDLKKILRSLDCVVISDHRCFAKPEQVVVELKLDNEIVPYLFALPKELGSFRQLFVSLGVSNDVSVSHYENVLVQIRETCQDNELEPNEIKAALKAVKGMYKTLRKSEGQIQVGKLYLPGKKGEAFFIQRSSDVVISDNSFLEKRATGDLNFVFLPDLKEENVDKMELWHKLPDSHKPSLLSQLMEEKLTESCRSECQQTDKCLQLQTAVSSPEVLKGITRLIKHYRFEEESQDCTAEIEQVQRFLSSIKIFCCSQITTCLMYQGSKIFNSEDFCQKQHCEEVKGNNTSEMHLFFLEKTIDENECCLQICKCLFNYYRKLPPQALLLIPTVIVHGYKKMSIHDYLNQQGIKEFCMDEPLQRKPDLPIPGSYIPVKFHCLLDQSFTFFEPEQYVGYEVYDPLLAEGDGDAVYIYAVVKEVVSASDASELQTMYSIDIGEIISVPATDLYAFHRKQVSATGEIVVFSGIASSTRTPDTTESKSLQEVKREIFKMLKEAWHMDEIRRKKVLKRLLLKWHPDKNPGREEFCTKVTQYIFALVKRFQGGDFSAFDDEKDTNDTARGGGGGGFRGGGGGGFRGGGGFHGGGFYGDFFARANSRGKQYGQNFSAFNNTDTTDGGCYHGYYNTSFNFERSYANPQPSEGRRWFRQAQADFDAIRNDQEGPKPSYAWMCFKCQQVAEKAMKAVLYKVNANSFSIRSHELVEIATSIGNSILTQLAEKLERTLGCKGYLRTRYPDMLHGQQIPCDVYTSSQAETSKYLCLEILKQVSSLLSS